MPALGRRVPGPALQVPAVAAVPIPPGIVPAAAAGQGPAAVASADGACLPQPAPGPGDVPSVPGPRVVARSLAEIAIEGRYRQLMAELDYLLEVELITEAEAARHRHQAQGLYEEGLADLLAWQAATGC